MFNLTISPAQAELVIKPGVTLTQVYYLTNNSDQTIILTPSVLPFTPKGFDGSVTYDETIQNPNVEFSLANPDVKLNQNFRLNPGQKTELVLQIKTYPQIPQGDNYYTFFISQATDTTFNTIPQSTARLGSHLLLSLSDSENPISQGEIKHFTTSPRIKDIFLTPITFHAEVKNNSEFFFKTAGTLTITKNKLVIAQTELDSQNVLANYSRTLTCQNQQPCTISPPFWPGQYTATIALDSTSSASPVSITFFVFPFSFCLILLIFAGLLFFFTRRRRSR
jgi:hypothetical protein